jgi:hypothetical protein
MHSPLHKLRIAFSTACGIACLVMAIEWPRSYHAEDRLSGRISSTLGFRIYSSRGCFVLYGANTVDTPRKLPWELTVGAEHWLNESDNRISRRPRFGYHPPLAWLTLPYGFLIVLTATLGCLPWFPWSRRYSVRTLLAVTTIIAVLLGLAVWGQ